MGIHVLNLPVDEPGPGLLELRFGFLEPAVLLNTGGGGVGSWYRPYTLGDSEYTMSMWTTCQSDKFLVL